MYRLNGSKMWASMANETDVGVLLAKTDPDAGSQGVSAFIVEPKKYPGFEARPIEMHGLSKALRTNTVFLDDFVVPVRNRLGEEGDGFKIVMPWRPIGFGEQKPIVRDERGHVAGPPPFLNAG